MERDAMKLDLTTFSAAMKLDLIHIDLTPFTFDPIHIQCRRHAIRGNLRRDTGVRLTSSGLRKICASSINR